MKQSENHSTQSDREETVVIWKHVITTFFGIIFECVPDNEPKETYWDDLMKWHSVTRERLFYTGGYFDSYDPKWVCFLLPQRFSLDQPPMPVAIDSKKMYEIIEPGDHYQKT